MRRLSIALVLLLLAPSLAAEEPSATDPHAAARKARDRICAVLEPLADELAKAGDTTGAQAVAETYLWVAGVPHPYLDALREAIKTKVAGERVDRALVPTAMKKLAPALAALGGSTRDWDVLDARLVAQLPEVLPSVRAINMARLHAGLVPMRYDAKRCVKEIQHARDIARHEPTVEPSVRDGRARYGVDAGLTTSLVLATPEMRVCLFDPLDKGLKIGTWPRVAPPPDPSEQGADPSPHRSAATCLAASGNKDPLAPAPRAPLVYPPPSERLPCRAAGLAAGHVYAQKIPVPITLHGFEAMPARGASIKVALKGQAVEGATWLVGGDGGWALAFAFHGPVAPGATYTFVARHGDGRVIKRWTMTTEAGEPEPR